MSRILLGTAGGLHEVGTDDAIDFVGSSVDAISPDGQWLISSAFELHTRGSSGWREVARAEGPYLTCLLPSPDGVLVGTEEAHLLRLKGERLEMDPSFENAAGREAWFTPWGGPPAVRSLTRTKEAVFVNVHVGGILRSKDGSVWEPTVDISSDVHEVRAVGDLLVAACAVGLAESGDEGFAWSFDDEGLHATYARAIAASSQFLFMSVSKGPRGGDAAIYRQPCDGDRAFERCDLPSFEHNIDTGCLDATEDLVAFGTKRGEVFASSDDGSTWEKAGSGYPPINHVTIQ